MKKTPNTSALTRRDFLKGAALAGAAIGFPTILPSSVFGQNAPSNRVTMGLIGVGGQMKGHRDWALNNKGAQVLAVCDVYRNRREDNKKIVESHYAKETAAGTYKGCDVYNEFERIVERKDIDAVIIATPDQWHVAISVAAIRAGKDVYVEKPMLLTVREGRLLADTAREYGAIVQVGSQQRSEYSFRRAAEMVRSGWIGKIREVQAYLGEFAPPLPYPEEPIPDGFDYDRWLGPAPWQPYSAQRVLSNFGGGWRNYWDYGSRKQGDWGAHHFDIIQWALDMDESGPVKFHPRNIDGNNLQTHTYANGVVVTRVNQLPVGPDDTQYMIRFIGEKGEVLTARGGSLATIPSKLLKYPVSASDVHLYKSDDHRTNWLDGIRTRKQPICTADVGYRTGSICALSGIAERLGRPLKWDPATEQIIGDEEASRWLDRPRRAPYFL